MTIPPRVLRDAPALHGTPVDPAARVSGVGLDSRRIVAGDLYAALPGASTHGARFAEQALARGAAAILTDPAGTAVLGDCPVPVVTVADPRGVLGELSAWVYGNPAESLLTFGITGTNGKTTMTFLLDAALRAAGHHTGVIGTTGIRIGDDQLPSVRTTPEAPDVHAVLALMRQRGVTALAMEVSSHALVLGRVDGLQFDVAGFTNLSQDHLDFHETMADYFAAKATLFTAPRAQRGVVCTDDAWGRRLAGEAAIPVTTYAGSPAGHPADWSLGTVTVSDTGAWQGSAQCRDAPPIAVSSPLPGDYNRANVLGALAMAAAAGVDPTAAAQGLADCAGVPGRMEAVPAAGFAAFVDYAHTPDAVARALSAARSFTTGRVLVALGCGGERDADKRPLMGAAAAGGADLVVVTDDNPRSEDPAMIRQQVLAGARDGVATVVEIADRRTAIEALVAQARPGDTVLLLGKGHETGQERDGVVTPFDDRIELRHAIARVTP